MPSLTIGKTVIDYTVRRSTRAKRLRIEVTPDAVEVIAPPERADADITDFIRSKRRWVYLKREEVQERASRLEGIYPQRIATGAKMPYRGRLLRLTVHRHAAATIDVQYRHGFLIHAPKSATDTDLRAALQAWFDDRIRADIDDMVRRYGRALDVTPRSLTIRDFRHRWGSCGKDGSIRINSRLIFAPKPVLEYVVVHELCHLIERNHSPAFWRTVRRLLPDYERPKHWLDHRGGDL